MNNDLNIDININPQTLETARQCLNKANTLLDSIISTKEMNNNFLNKTGNTEFNTETLNQTWQEGCSNLYKNIVNTENILSQMDNTQRELFDKYSNMDLVSSYVSKINVSNVSEVQERDKVVSWLLSYLGTRTGSKKQKEIVDVFNEGVYPRSWLHTDDYVMRSNEAWCAAAVTASFIGSGMSDAFPCGESLCPKIIEKAEANNMWHLKNEYSPIRGDVIMFENGYGTAVHTALVTDFNSLTGEISYVEGNSRGADVRENSINISDKTVFGFVVPKYENVSNKNNSLNSEENSLNINKNRNYVQEEFLKRVEELKSN